MIKDIELAQFFCEMYERFGQWAVINFVKERQSSGELLQVSWANCSPCEEYTPMLDRDCLVCGEASQ